MHPCEEDERVCDELVKGDVLVELYDIIQWRLSGEGDQTPADRKEDQGDVEV